MVLPPATLLLMGIQGSGKGTQAQYLSERYGFTFISMGDLLRAEKETDTDRGRMLKKIVEAGELVPDDVSTSILLDEVTKLPADARLIIDGHPRTAGQAGFLLEGLKGIGREEFTALFITLTEEEGMKRLLERGRHDDTEESIRKRFGWSKEKMVPVAEAFGKQDRLIEVDGVGTMDEVHERIVGALKLGS